MASGVAGAEGERNELPVACRAGVMIFPGVFTLVRDADKQVIGAMLVCSGPGTAPAV